MKISPNMLALVTDKRGARFGETSCKEKARPKPGYDGDPNDAKLEPVFHFHWRVGRASEGRMMSFDDDNPCTAARTAWG
jgi:hypothetical protein